MASQPQLPLAPVTEPEAHLLSTVTDSDTPSASSGTALGDHRDRVTPLSSPPPSTHQHQYQHQYQPQQHHSARYDDRYSQHSQYSRQSQYSQQLHQHHHRLTSNASSTSPRSRSQTAESVYTASATPRVSASATPFPVPNSPIRRKPVPSIASSLAASRTSYATPPLVPSIIELPKPEQRFSRAPSIDSPTLYNQPSAFIADSHPQSHPSDVNLAPSDFAGLEPGNRSPAVSATEQSDVLSAYGDLISNGSYNTPDAAQDAHSANTVDSDDDDFDAIYGRNSNSNSDGPPMFAPKPTPPHLRLEKVDTTVGQEVTHLNIEPESPGSLAASPSLNKPLPKSPSQVSPLASLFGWGNSPSATEFSSIPGSPSSPTKNGQANDVARSTNNLSPTNTQSNASTTNPVGYCETQLSTPPPQVAFSALQIEEMEDELKAISSELAASIRREMDLEDLVDRLQDQVNNPQAPSKRTSDYFSDSGYSSAKLSENEQSRDEIDKIQRRSEQEKASLRLELTNKLQDERSIRKQLDQQIRQLSERASQMDLAQINSMDANGRLQDLESTCEDLRRKLSQERQSKTNFEDLLTALKAQLSDVCNERDNLRDEVVPSLRARVEGLETEAAEYASLTYESTKMQHQLQSLKQENTSLRNSTTGLPDELLAKANSASAAAFLSQMAPGLGLSRSDSVKNGQPESREALAERLKDVEAQRDALHKALKNLLERQEFQNRENDKKVRVLEQERQRLLEESPKKAGFERDISNLRTEISVLRRRAEDALEQKWQVEKGLGGLKMDLDRAEAEIATLRSLLSEKDILIPPSMTRSNGSEGAPITSEALENSYKDLQSAYADTIKHIGSGGAASDEKTKLAIQRLERSLAEAITARDAAKQEARGLKQQNDSLAASEAKHSAAELALADELSNSAQRVEDLAIQVRQQLATNAELRTRLSDTVARGDTDRKANTNRITTMQERLKVLEDDLINAQTASEERVGRHEDEITKLRDAHNEQLSRLNNGSGIGMKTARKAPLLNPNAASVFSRVPDSMPAKSFEDEVELKALRTRVAELEKALADAEEEMQEVVARMSAAQIEVMNLQEERETAARETRRLQKLLQQEQTKAGTVGR